MRTRAIFYRSVWSIEVGDILTTGYASGPYEVLAIRGPIHWEDRGIWGLALFAQPKIGLTLCPQGEGHRMAGRGGSRYCGIEEVTKDQVFVLTDTEPLICQLDQRPAIEHVAIPSYNQGIYIQKNPRPSIDLVYSLFPPVGPPDAWLEPYQRRPGVEYTAQAWHCRQHGDFNAPPIHPHAHVAMCPYRQRGICDAVPIYDEAISRR